MTRANDKGRAWRRSLGRLMVVLGLVLPAPLTPEARAQAGKPVVQVFLQLDAKSSAVEKALQEHLPELGITVFGRFRDFEEGMSSGKPDAVFSITPVLDQYKKKVTLQGQRGGKGAEPYVLASVNQVLEGPLTGKTIGVVDVLGREGTQTFLSGLAGASDMKIKRVAKVEDLLPLLEFSAADAIVLPASMVARLTERTRLVIKTKELTGGPVGLPAVAVLNPATKDVVVKAFQKLDPATKTLLGIDSWSVR